MENFKLASQQRLRIQTTKGLLSVEQLWDLSIPELDSLAVKLEQEHKDSGKKSFIAKKTIKDRTAKLKFDIVLDILETKVEEEIKATERAENKEHNKKILELIASKKDESLGKKSIKELESMLREE